MRIFDVAIDLNEKYRITHTHVTVKSMYGINFNKVIRNSTPFFNHSKYKPSKF